MEKNKTKKTWRQRNPEKEKAQKQRHYKKHRDEINKYQRKWRKRNKDKTDAYNKLYTEKNPEKNEKKNFKAKIRSLGIDLSFEEFNTLLKKTKRTVCHLW